MNTRTNNVPRFLDLAGHPVRWRMLVELAGCDRQVGEVDAGSWSAAGPRLVSPRASSRRRAWCRHVKVRSTPVRFITGHTSIAAASCSRPPAPRFTLASRLRPAHAASDAPVRARAVTKDSRRASVLFVCTGNGTRSQIAEALLRTKPATVEVVSAGSHPKPIHPNAIRVLADIGIDISAARSKPTHTIHRPALRLRDYVVRQGPRDLSEVSWSWATHALEHCRSQRHIRFPARHGARLPGASGRSGFAH